MLHVEHPRLAGAGRMVKATFDWLGALALATLFAPLLVAVAVAIRLDSPGPVLFRQVRVGRHGKEFMMVKFRSMCHDAPARLSALRPRNDCDGVLFKMRDDPRVTRVGRWLLRPSPASGRRSRPSWQGARIPRPS